MSCSPRCSIVLFVTIMFVTVTYLSRNDLKMQLLAQLPCKSEVIWQSYGPFFFQNNSSGLQRKCIQHFFVYFGPNLGVPKIGENPLLSRSTLYLVLLVNLIKRNINQN